MPQIPTAQQLADWKAVRDQQGKAYEGWDDLDEPYLEHLPGKHDQSTLGRGGGGGASTKSEPKAPKAAKASKAEPAPKKEPAPKAPKVTKTKATPVASPKEEPKALEPPKEEPPKEEPKAEEPKTGSSSDQVFPSQEEFEQAKLKAFGAGHSLNATFKTSINGQDYFVKQSDNSEDNANEVGAYLMGKAAGIDQHLVPVQLMQQDGDKLLVQPWTSGEPLAKLSSADIQRVCASLSPEEFTRVHAFEYLVGEMDGNTGNYLYDGNHMTRIDMGLAFNSREFNQADASFPTYASDLALQRAKGMGTSLLNLSWHQPTLASMVSQGPAILAAARSSGINSAKYQGVQNRLAALAQLAQNSNPTLQDLVNNVGIRR
jgi:hypothetical protein